MENDNKVDDIDVQGQIVSTVREITTKNPMLSEHFQGVNESNKTSEKFPAEITQIHLEFYPKTEIKGT